jgi:transposase
VGCDSIGLRVTTEIIMAWTEITRPQYRRAGLRYANDLTDAEWAMIAPFMPERRRFGRRRSTKLRAVVEAMFYIASTGCQWRQLPKDFPPYSTVQGYFYAWVLDGRWELINHALVITSREKAGCRNHGDPVLPAVA